MFVFRIWADALNSVFADAQHCHPCQFYEVAGIATGIGKKLNDYGKQETHNPDAIFFLHLSFLLSIWALWEDSLATWTDRELGHFQARSPQRTRAAGSVSQEQNVHRAGRNCFCCVLEPVHVLCALTPLWVGVVLRWGFRRCCLNIRKEISLGGSFMALCGLVVPWLKSSVKPVAALD